MRATNSNEPADGDFASYVEQLTRARGGEPGRVEVPERQAHKRKLPASPAGTPGTPPARPVAKPAVLRAPPPDAGTATQGLQRLARVLNVVGIVVLVLGILRISPIGSPLGGFALLAVALILRRLARR
ncbi:MAG: hypothetical protein IT508_10275 [Burkholderiaceae bacterium]|nr:hypothetical protein [Burkholderiaceae bacterium]